MSQITEPSPNNLFRSAPPAAAAKRWVSALGRPETLSRAREAITVVVVSFALAGILLFARGLSSRWADLLVLATITPTVVLLIKNLQKWLFVLLVVDIPLGFDIALMEQVEQHIGGPIGFEVSLMTIVLVVGYGLWITDRSSTESKAYVHADVTGPALVYLFALLVSAFQAVNVGLTLTQLFLEIQFFLMFFYIINHVKTWSQVRLIITTLVVCLLLESILMLAQYSTGFELAALGVESGTVASGISSAATRAGGTLRSPNAAATYLTASIPIALAAYLTDKRLVDRRLALSAIVFAAAALITTQSRSGMIAFALTMLMLGAQALRKRLGVKAILLLCVVALVIGSQFSETILERFTADDNYSAQSRIWQNQMAFNIINKHTFTGIGLNNQWLVLHDYLPLELMGRWIYIVHNKYLLIWSEVGLFGILSFILLLLAAARRALQMLFQTDDNYISIVMTGLLAAQLVYWMQMLSEPMAGRVRMQFLWFILGLTVAIHQIVKQTKRLPDSIS